MKAKTGIILLTLIFTAFAFMSSLYAIQIASDANALSEESIREAEKANSLAEEANEISLEAKAIALEGNDLEKFRISYENLQKYVTKLE